VLHVSVHRNIIGHLCYRKFKNIRIYSFYFIYFLPGGSDELKFSNQTKLLNKPISPRRFKEGGAAILQALNKNHYIAILGIKLIKPLLIKRLRLPKRS
jgi:hypothetical protein